MHRSREKKTPALIHSETQKDHVLHSSLSPLLNDVMPFDQ